MEEKTAPPELTADDDRAMRRIVRKLAKAGPQHRAPKKAQPVNKPRARKGKSRS
jgi:hypothetical protein